MWKKRTRAQKPQPTAELRPRPPILPTPSSAANVMTTTACLKKCSNFTTAMAMSLKQLNDRPACDRYEYLKQLKELDEAYRANWESYDHYQDGDDLTPFRPAKDVRTEHVAVAAKRIVAARKYISHNHSQLPLVTDESKRALIMAKMQERVDLILSAGESFDASYRAELEKTGLRFE